jgi:protein TonB
MKTLIIIFTLSLTTAYHQLDWHSSENATSDTENPSSYIESDTTEFVPYFLFADQYPEYPGGEQEMIRYIRENIEYPELAYSHGHEGTVIVEFVVEENGSIGQLKILRSVGLGCDEAALAVFDDMPQWRPAVQGGRAIAVRYITPVKFSLF